MTNDALFLEYAADILPDQGMKASRSCIQHGTISVFTHCVMVSRYSLGFAKALHLKIDERSLVRGALLHDYFLYDWHLVKKEEIGGLHGFVHPVIAAKNAKKQFELSDKEYNVILCHMWPLTLTRIPKSREGWIVTLVDKYCSLLETIRCTPYNNESVLRFAGENNG